MSQVGSRQREKDRNAFLFFAHMPISVPGMSAHPHSCSLPLIPDSTTSQGFCRHNLGEIDQLESEDMVYVVGGMMESENLAIKLEP